MKQRIYHAFFWAVYLFYAIFIVVISTPADPHLFAKAMQIAAELVYLGVLPFYVFTYTLNLTMKKGTTLAGILFFIVFFAIHFYCYYLLYTPFLDLLFSGKNDLPFSMLLTSYLASCVNYFIFATGYYFLTRSKKVEKDLLIVQKEKLEEEEKRLQAEVAFLKAQINPHFLHNVLNYFYAQALPLSNTLAEGILSLSDIMRYALDRNNDKEGLVWIYKEIGFVKKIININTLRFDGNIFTKLQVTGDDISSLKIIPMILITMVENAFKHGELHKPEYPLQIDVHYDANEKLFSFSVFNHKKKGPKEISHGIGLDNTLSRLRMAYKENASLVFEEDDKTYKASLQLKY